MNSFIFEIAMATLTLMAAAGLFLAWFFIRRARFKEKIILIEKGIDVKDLNLLGGGKLNFQWLKIGIVLTGLAFGLIIVSLILISPAGEKFSSIRGFSLGIIVLTSGLSMILANFVGRDKVQK